MTTTAQQKSLTGLNSVQIAGLVLGIGGLALVGLGASQSVKQMLQSYTFAYLFWFGLGLGCFGLLMIHHLVGGRWGFMSRRLLEAGAMTLPLMAVLFAPFVLGILTRDQNITPYKWADPTYIAGDALLEHKQPFLNVEFFLIRAAIYWIIWIGITLMLYKWSYDQDRAKPGDFAPARRMRFVSGIGMVLYVLTMTFAAIDWGMSLEPHWYSGIYGVIFMVGQGLTTLAMIVLMFALLRKTPPMNEVLLPVRIHDVGKLMFAFVILWTYMSFSQYIIQWAANLPEETPWYIARTSSGWTAVSMFLILFHFAVPFFILLSRRIKRDLSILWAIAASLLVVHLINMFWLIMPNFYPELTVHWLDIVSVVGVGGIWLALFIWLIKRRPLLPLNDDYHDPRKRAGGH
ncbi:MAG: hypothetical protein HC837_00355 [Chloroflexaceae bacterium]|nr:hypothetical protein [Chloroflexaceae bacterium]